MTNAPETTEQKAINELQKAEHGLAEAVTLEHRAEADITKAEHRIEKIEEELARQSRIIVNGRQRTIEGHEVSYEEAVKLAYPDGHSQQDIKYTVTFRNAVRPERSGELDAGQRVTVKHGRHPLEETIFNVTPTLLS